MLVETSDLIDSGEVAAILGLNNPGGVSVYRRRYAAEGFPAPVVEKGRCLLWLRSEVEAWKQARRRAD